MPQEQPPEAPAAVGPVTEPEILPGVIPRRKPVVTVAAARTKRQEAGAVLPAGILWEQDEAPRGQPATVVAEPVPGPEVQQGAVLRSQRKKRQRVQREKAEVPRE